MKRKKDILPVNVKLPVTSWAHVARCNPEASLGSVLERTASSHDPIFIFKKDGTFLGLVSPLQSLYMHHLPLTTIVRSCAFHPPYLHGGDGLTVAAAHMSSTRLYTLPVFDDRAIVGVVRANDIFHCILHQTALLSRVVERLCIHAPITIKHTATVGDVYTLMRRKGVSRMVVVNDSGTLVGIVCRSDLKPVLIRPSPRQRFSKSSGDTGESAFDAEEIKRNDNPIETVYQKQIVSAPVTWSMTDIITHLIRSGKSSIILTDARYHPVGFISTRDLLLAIAALPTTREIPISIEKPDGVHALTVVTIYELLREFGDKLQQRVPVKRISVSFKEAKSTQGFPVEFETTLITALSYEDQLVSQAKARNLTASLSEAIKRISKQQRRTHRKTVTERNDPIIPKLPRAKRINITTNR